jgi:hypothetical protein
MTQEQKALAALRMIATMIAADGSITFSGDWDFGSGSITLGDGSHSHFGGDFDDDPEINFARFVDGLHDMLCEHRGLSFAKPSNG